MRAPLQTAERAVARRGQCRVANLRVLGCACTHTRTHTHTRARAHAHTHTHARAHTHTHARTHARTHTRTHAHTHTHAAKYTQCTRSVQQTRAHRSGSRRVLVVAEGPQDAVAMRVQQLQHRRHLRLQHARHNTPVPLAVNVVPREARERRKGGGRRVRQGKLRHGEIPTARSE